MRRYGGLSTGTLLLMIVLAGGRHAEAQAPAPLHTAPSSDECRVQPRTVAELKRLAAEALATPSPVPAPEPDSSTFVPPTGELADPETTAAAMRTIRESFACLAAGDMLAAQALNTDARVRQALLELALPLERVGGLDELFGDPGFGTPEALPPELRPEPTDVREVRLLNDGRVGAVVEVRLPSIVGREGTRLDYYLLQDVDGRYLIDDQVVDIRGEGLSGNGAAPGGTPSTTAPS